MRKLLFILLFLLIAGKNYGEAIVREDDVKAAFIFHFITFTEWADDNSNYYVCIPDDDGLKDVVRDSLEDKTINNRTIVVVDKVFDGCHVIVADAAGESDSILTIGRLARGAMFEFRTVNNKLKFAVNPDVIKKSKLKVSSQLLKLAILEESSS